MHVDQRLRLAVGAALLGAALVAGRGCGSTEDAMPDAGSGGGVEAGIGGIGGWQTVDSGGAGGLGGVAASGSAGQGGTGGNKCAPVLSVPVVVPDDWEPYQGYSCECVLWVPGAKGAMPEPVTWEPCPPGIPTPKCERMATPWTKNVTDSLAAFPQFWRDAATDTAYAQFGRVFVNDDKNVRYRVVANLDGPVVNAFLEVKPPCTLLNDSLSDGRYAFGAQDIGAVPADFEGIVAGEIGKAPSVAMQRPVENKTTTKWFASKSWIFEGRPTLSAYSSDLSEKHLVYTPATDPEALPVLSAQGLGGALFFEVSVSGYHGVMAWTLGGGLQPLIRYIGDSTQGAGNFTTDGVDMVWTRGENKPPGTEPFYPARSVMTAKYTTDPAVRAATEKRLRSDPGQLETQPYGIGCGYAARSYIWGTAGLFIVRLSDGVSWTIEPTGKDVQFISVLGLSCKDVFVNTQFPDESVTFVRIPLDSLGPGTPPD